MQVVSSCPQCGHSFGWTMNQMERTPDGGSRPARAPNCPRCNYDVTGSNDRAPRNFHYFAKMDDAEAMEHLARTQGNVNAPAPDQSFSPLVIAAIYGSSRAAEFLLKNGVDSAQIAMAIEKAREFRHPAVTRLLTDYSALVNGVGAGAAESAADITPAVRPGTVVVVGDATVADAVSSLSAIGINATDDSTAVSTASLIVIVQQAGSGPNSVHRQAVQSIAETWNGEVLWVQMHSDNVEDADLLLLEEMEARALLDDLNLPGDTLQFAVDSGLVAEGSNFLRGWDVIGRYIRQHV